MINTELYLFLIFILNGLIIGVLFDFFRILRKAIRTSDLITCIEDIVFWILTGLIILYSIFTYNNGEIRLFMFLAIIIGIILYMVLISKFIMRISLMIINIVQKVISIIINIIKIPINLLIKLIKKIFLNPISFIILNIRKFFTNFFKNLSDRIKKVRKSNKFAKNSKNKKDLNKKCRII